MSDKTLVIGPSWVGDMVMAQSLFKAIKANNPQTCIDVLAPEWSRPLTQRMPEISNSLISPFKHGELKLRERYRLGKMLSSKGYHRAFVLPNSFKSALIPFWAKIPERVGWAREARALLFTSARILNKKSHSLMVQRYIALAFEKNSPLPHPMYRPSLTVSPDSVTKALQNYQLTLDKPVLILCPGAEFGPSKRWPEEYYAELANYYLQKGVQVWILGSPKDNTVANEIQTRTHQQCVDLTGKTSLGDAIDLMSTAQIVVTNDSGLMHIAAALDRPLVALYGSTDPGFTPPLNEKVTIVREGLACSPCFKRTCPLQHHDCMQRLSVEKVIQAVNASVNL